jgi:RNA polymerase sigma factor (sigma-70 family)
MMKNGISEEFLRYRKVIASLLRRIRPAATQQDIEDILQDTFINTYKSSLTQEIKFPKSFMIKTAIRLANRQIELSRRMDSVEYIEEFSDESLSIYDIGGFSSSTEREVLYRQDFGLLCEAINQLPSQCRRVFILKKIYGFSQRDIAERLNISQSTVEKHVAKGLLKAMGFYHRSQSKALSLRHNELSEKSVTETSRLSLIGFKERVLKLKKRD